MAAGSSLESHMTEISKTILQLAQTHEKIVSTQPQNHQTMVTCPAVNKQMLLKL